ncbi:MAG: DUF5657 family protein [Patescibacteria group bacterium]
MDIIPVLGISVWLVVKAFFLFAILLYIVFALVVIKQVRLMTDTLEIGLEEIIRLVAYIHLAFAILVFVFALITL